jgi:phenylacetate-CoA ligase
VNHARVSGVRNGLFAAARAVEDLVYPPFANRLYLPLVRARKQIGYSAILREAMANQRLPREDLDALQLSKLRALVEHAKASSPFYRERLRGVDASALRTRADLERLPLLEKSDIAAHHERIASERFVGRKFGAVTSGSTGVALRFAFDSRHLGWVDAVQERAQAWWGLRATDRAIILWGRPVDGGFRAQLKIATLYRLRNRLAFNTFALLDDTFLARIVRAIERFRPRLVYGYGSSLGALARHLDRQGETLSEAAAPRVVQFTGDHMFEDEQAIAARVFRAPVASVYGSSEGGGTAQPCPHGGQHLSADHMLVEICRPDGSRAAPGESGEIVITPLHNFAFPFLRYRIGDVGSMREAPCTCGVTLPLMDLEVGKSADLITTSSRERVSPYVLDYLNKHLLRTGVRGIGQFLVEQTGLDDFILHLVKTEPFDPQSVTFFTQKMREYLGDAIRVEVRFVETIPVSSSGKRRWFKKSLASGAPAPRGV